MASYLDSTPQFKPYVQQLPVQAMVEVGMQKQHQYDEGYQRIQSQIDKVAGLSVMRDVDKQYLQSKMNELGNNLRMVSMGDFSNYQLVNSVGGMVNQVGKDKYIQSAVMSTARIQKELSNMEKLRNEGKSDKNNEAYFHEKILNPYLSAGLKDKNNNPVSFSGSFSPYVDITDEVRKLAKDAGIDEDVIQQMYSTDASGNAIPARTMTEVKTSSNEAAIEGILNTVLSRGDIQNQMNIDAWANTRGVDPIKMLSGYEQKFNENFLLIDQEKARLNTLLEGKASDQQKAQIEAQIKNLDRQKLKYRNQLAELTSLAKDNPEVFKERLYRTNYENSLKGMFIKTKREEKNLDNPLTKQLNWEREFDLKSSSEMFDRGMANKNYQLALDKFDAEFPLGKDGKRHPVSKGKNSGGDGGDESGRGMGTSASVSGANDLNATQVFEDTKRSLYNESYNTGFELMYDMFSRSDKAQKKSPEQFQQYINMLAKTQNQSPEEFVNHWLQGVNNEAISLGVDLSGYDRKLLDKFTALRSKYLDKVAIGANIDKRVQDQQGISPNEYIKNLISFSVPTEDGKIRTYSREEIASLLATGNTAEIEEMQKGLIRKYGVLQNKVIGTPAYANPTAYAYESTPEWIAISKVKDNPRFKEVVKEKERMLREITMTESNRSIPFGESDKEIKATKSRVLAAVSGNPNIENRDEILDALGEEGSTGAFIIKQPFAENQPFTGEVVVVNKGKEYRFTVENQEDLSVLTTISDFQQFRENPYVSRAKTSGTHSTNLGTDTGKDYAWKTAYISPNTTPLLQASSKYIPLGADLNLMPGDATWTVSIYLKDRQTGKILKPIELNTEYYVGSESVIVNDLTTLTEPQVDQIIKNRQK